MSATRFVDSLKDLSTETPQEIELFCNQHPDPFTETPQNITDLFLLLFGVINKKGFLNSAVAITAEKHFANYEKRFRSSCRLFANLTIDHRITNEVIRYLFFMSLPLFHVPLSLLVAHPKLHSDVLLLEKQILEGMELIFKYTSEPEMGLLTIEEQNLVSMVARKRKAFTRNGVCLSQEAALRLWSLESPTYTEFCTRVLNALRFKDQVQTHSTNSIPLSPDIESPRRASDPNLTPKKKPASLTPPATPSTTMRGKEEFILTLSPTSGERAPPFRGNKQEHIIVDPVVVPKKLSKTYQEFLIEETIHSLHSEYQIPSYERTQTTLRIVFFDETLRSWIVDFLEDIHNEFSKPQRKNLYRHCLRLLDEFAHFLIAKTFSFYWDKLKEDPERVKKIQDQLPAFFKDPDCKKRAKDYVTTFTRTQAEATLHIPWLCAEDNLSSSIHAIYLWLQGVTTFLLFRQKIQKCYPCNIDYALMMDWIGQTSLQEQVHLRTSLEYDSAPPLSFQIYRVPRFWTFLTKLSLTSLAPIEILSLLLRFYQIDYPPPVPEEKKAKTSFSPLSSLANLFRSTPVLDMESLFVEEKSLPIDREGLSNILSNSERLGAFKTPPTICFELFYENIQNLKQLLGFLSHRFELNQDAVYRDLHAGVVSLLWNDEELWPTVYALLRSCSLSHQRALSTSLQARPFTQIQEKIEYINWSLNLPLEPFHMLQLAAAIYQENMNVIESFERHKKQVGMIEAFENDLHLPLSSKARYALLSTLSIIEQTTQLFSAVGRHLQQLETPHDFGPALKTFVESPLYPTHAPFLEFIQSLFPFDNGLDIVLNDSIQRMTSDKQGWGVWQSWPQKTLFTGYYFFSTRTDALYHIQASLPFNWSEISTLYPRLKDFFAQLFKEPLLRPTSNWGELSETGRNIVRDFNPPEKNVILNQLTHFVFTLRWQYRKLFLSPPTEPVSSELEELIKILFPAFQKNEKIKFTFPWQERPHELDITLTPNPATTLCTVAFKSFSHSVELSKTSSARDLFLALLPALHKSQAMAKALNIS